MSIPHEEEFDYIRPDLQDHVLPSPSKHGMGVLGPNAGQDTLTTDPVETAIRMRNEIKKTRALTDKPFAVQYFIPMQGDPYGFSTVESAKNIEAAGADIIIATGYDEGGGVPSHAIGTMTIVPLIADAVKIPVLAAGGIVDNRGVKASLILGAEGVYVGTLFITSLECPASDECKQDIVNAKTEDLIEIGKIPTWRCTPHKLSLELHAMEQKGVTKEEINTKLSNGSLRLGMREGDLDAGIVSVSNAVGLIKNIKS